MAFWRACVKVEMFLKVIITGGGRERGWFGWGEERGGRDGKTGKVMGASEGRMGAGGRVGLICRSIGLYDVNVFTLSPLFSPLALPHPLYSLTSTPPPLTPSPLCAGQICRGIGLYDVKICRGIGLYDVNVFTPPDLVERRDLRRVYLCLRTLSKRTIGIKVGQPSQRGSSRSFATPTSAASFLTLATASATSAAAASSAATVTSATAATAGQPAADRSIPRWWAPAYPRPASPSRRFSHSSSVAAWQASSAAAAAAAAGTGAAGAGAAGAATGGAGAGVSRSVRGDYLPNLPTWLGPEQQAVVRSRSPARVPPWVLREGGGPAEAAPLATVTPRQPTPPRTHTSPLRSISPPTSFHPSEPESLPDTSSMGRGGGGRMGQQEELGLLEQQQEGQQGRGLGARKWQLLAAAGAAVLVGGAVVMAAQRHQRLRSTGASSDRESENLRRRSSDSRSRGNLGKGKGSAEAGLEPAAVGKVESEGGFSHWLASMPTGAKLTEKEFDDRFKELEKEAVEVEEEFLRCLGPAYNEYGDNDDDEEEMMSFIAAVTSKPAPVKSGTGEFDKWAPFDEAHLTIDPFQGRKGSSATEANQPQPRMQQRLQERVQLRVQGGVWVVVALSGGLEAVCMRRARMQLHLPVRLGGFGIRAAASLSPLSYVCGWAQAARDIAQLGVAGEEAMFAEYLTTSAGAEFLDPWFAKALEQLSATIRQEMPGLPLCVAAPPLRLFQARQRLLAVEELQTLRRSARDDATLARFTSLQGPGAGAWVSAVPAHSDLTFTAAEWGIAAAIRLGLPIQQLQVAGRCVCGTAYVDSADPHHALRCKHQHGPSRVHDEVKFAVAKISKASGGVVTMEDSVVLQGKRVDVAVRRPMAGEAHALEISVADPLSLSPSLLGQCGRQIGVAAREWERRKTSDYAPLLARNRGVQFTPLIVETWGCLGGRFRRWLRQQGDAHVGLAVSRGACREDDTVFSAYLLGSLKALIGVALQRAQARVILFRAASSMGGINVDLVDREWDDGDAEGGALWVEAPYMVDSLL
ncbi:unnamed protein product [Closterium sp. NIES-65]|nr:unnamed protein product [Closterium sp. NIES-65]